MGILKWFIKSLQDHIPSSGCLLSASPCSALSQRVTASFFGTLARIAWESTNQAIWTSGSRHGLHHLPRKASLLRSRDVYISPPPLWITAFLLFTGRGFCFHIAALRRDLGVPQGVSCPAPLLSRMRVQAKNFGLLDRWTGAGRAVTTCKIQEGCLHARERHGARGPRAPSACPEPEPRYELLGPSGLAPRPSSPTEWIGRKEAAPVAK